MFIFVVLSFEFRQHDDNPIKTDMCSKRSAYICLGEMMKVARFQCVCVCVLSSIRDIIYSDIFVIFSGPMLTEAY